MTKVKTKRYEDDFLMKDKEEQERLDFQVPDSMVTAALSFAPKGMTDAGREISINILNLLSGMNSGKTEEEVRAAWSGINWSLRPDLLADIIVMTQNPVFFKAASLDWISIASPPPPRDNRHIEHHEHLWIINHMVKRYDFTPLLHTHMHYSTISTNIRHAFWSNLKSFAPEYLDKKVNTVLVDHDVKLAHVLLGYAAEKKEVIDIFDYIKTKEDAEDALSIIFASSVFYAHDREKEINKVLNHCALLSPDLSREFLPDLKGMDPWDYIRKKRSMNAAVSFEDILQFKGSGKQHCSWDKSLLASAVFSLISQHKAPALNKAFFSWWKTQSSENQIRFLSECVPFESKILDDQKIWKPFLDGMKQESLREWVRGDVLEAIGTVDITKERMDRLRDISQRKLNLPHQDLKDLWRSVKTMIERVNQKDSWRQGDEYSFGNDITPYVVGLFAEKVSSSVTAFCTICSSNNQAKKDLAIKVLEDDIQSAPARPTRAKKKI